MTSPTSSPQAAWPAQWRDLRVVALDVETTGFDADVERIIELGLVTFEAGEVVDTWGVLINPGKPIPDEVVELTGIRNEDVADKPPFAEFAEELNRRLQGVGICAYNLSFDRKFITQELRRCGFDWPIDAPTFDPLIFARQFQSEHRRHSLGKVADRLGITLENAHRATDDAEVAGQILYAFAPQLPGDLKDVLVLQAQWEQLQEQAQSWRRRARGDEPSAALQAVSMLGAKAIGLGPAYLYGEELDPLRAIYMSVPEVER